MAPADLWDDSEEWQEMPVVRSDNAPSSSSEDERASTSKTKAAPKRKSLKSTRARSASSALKTQPAYLPPSAAPTANATGAKIEVEWEDSKGRSLGKPGEKGRWEWREKREGELDESAYTRLELDEDKEAEEVWERTGYLFDDELNMTPLAQLRATKNLLTPAQRIAYVGLCRLVTREMCTPLRLAREHGAKELSLAEESLNNWSAKIMGRLYQHMDIVSDEQRMIENLAVHGLTSEDLVPSLVTTHTVPNPEYDPQFAKELEREREEEERKKSRAQDKAGQLRPI
ncbi:hypothetical protein BT69DRAFT_843081 [Atractiella rhizophila]|nr:hypothetical protein BT69DRAFT_843081 [Atractiella rhizophila]